MSAWKGLREILFWAAALLGAGLLAPSLILPAWLERQGQLEYLQKQQQLIAALQYRLQATRTQIDHVEKDPAYVLRLAQQEFGSSVPGSQGETVVVGPDTNTVDDVLPPELANAVTTTDVLPELSAVIAGVMQRYPHAQMFVDYRRAPLMATGGVLVLTAVLVRGLTDGDPRRSDRARKATR